MGLPDLKDKITNLWALCREYRTELLLGNRLVQSKLSSLNKELDCLYELMYSQFNHITPSDYNVYGEAFQDLIVSVEELYAACEGNVEKSDVEVEEIELLGRSYSALKELADDIHNYKVSMDEDAEMAGLLSKAAQLMDKDLMDRDDNMMGKLEELPVCECRAVRMEETKGDFFDLKLKDGIRLTMSRYDDDGERVYANVILDGEPVIQDCMTVEALVAMLREFYDGESVK